MSSGAHVGASTGRNQLQAQYKQSNTLTLRQILSSNTSDAKDLENTGNTQDEIAAIQSLYLNLDNNKENQNGQNIIVKDEAGVNQRELAYMEDYCQESKSKQDLEW